MEPLSLEARAERTRHYLQTMVDGDGLPYFNVFWTDPAEAAHDWPDFGDVTARQLQAAVMLRHMTGTGVTMEGTWRQALLARLDPADGLLHRPATTFSSPGADPGDAALTLYALATDLAGRPDDRELRDVVCRMVDGIRGRGWERLGDGFMGGCLLEPLLAAYRAAGCEPAFEAAKELAAVNADRLLPADGIHPAGTHVHGTLRGLLCVSTLARAIGDGALLERARVAFDGFRRLATRFGFLPEVVGRAGDVITCETCALLDYIGTGVALANAGMDEYWGVVERVVRNHLVESQVEDTSWLTSPHPVPQDTDQFTWRDVGARMRGGWAGWSSPNHLLGARETLHWGGPELRGKTRAFQNCCGGSGGHALFIAWKHASVCREGTVRVHLHLDKLLPEAEVRCHQPRQGRTTVHLRQGAAVAIRLPDFCPADEVRLTVDGSPASRVRRQGAFLHLERLPAGSLVEALYPVPSVTEEIAVGNPGFRHHRYRVRWQGDTVLELTPLGNEHPTGHSDFERAQVPVFYGTEGPAPLYRRGSGGVDATPGPPAPLHEDRSPIDFW